MANPSDSIKARFSHLWRRVRHFREDRDLDDELRAHIEMLTEDNLAAGLSPAEAARRARVQLGNPRVVVEKVRDQEFLTPLEGWYRDFLLGLRALRRSPVFSLTAILTLALGIGANTAIFTLLYGLLLRSLPVPDAHRLARIGVVSAASQSRGAFFIPYRMLHQLRRQQNSFTGVSPRVADSAAIEDNDAAVRFYNAGLVSGDAFLILGMAPYLGRLHQPG